MYCGKCGTELRKGGKFCQVCGAPVAASSGVVPPADPRPGTEKASGSPSGVTVASPGQSPRPFVEKGTRQSPASDLPPRSSRKIPVLLIVCVAAVVLILVVALAGGYWYWKSRTEAPNLGDDAVTEEGPAEKAANREPSQTPPPQVQGKEAAPQTPAEAPRVQKTPGKAQSPRTGAARKAPEKQQSEQARGPARQQQAPQKSSGSWVHKILGPTPTGPAAAPADPRETGQ